MDRLRGALFESYAAQNLGALLEAHRPDAQLAYWHEQGRYEVDFVIAMGRRVVAIEVKAATRWNAGDLASLRAFLARTPACAAAVLAYNGREPVKTGGQALGYPTRPSAEMTRYAVRKALAEDWCAAVCD